MFTLLFGIELILLMASTALPLYVQQQQKLSTNFFSFSGRRSIFRLREKYLVILAITLFALLCYSGFIFLPDSSTVTNNVRIKSRIESAFGNLKMPENPGDFVIPRPKLPSNASYRHLRHEEHVAIDPHQQIDLQRFKDKMLLDKTDKQSEILEKGNDGTIDVGQMDSYATTAGNANAEEFVEMQRRTIKEMMITAWDGYKSFAWGANELRPNSKVAHSASIFGSGNLGATIIDGLDTLHIMGLTSRFEDGKKWVEMSFGLENIHGDISVFETNIRFIGGLLTCYAMTKDELFKSKAVEIADALLPAFDTPTGIPYALIDVKSKKVKNFGWASGGASILSEFGTLHLEFDYLTEITGNSVYRSKIVKIRNVLKEMEKPGGLYPNYLNPKTKKWGSRHVSLGALGDSFYEYLLKAWLITSKYDLEAKLLYDDAIKAIEEQLVQKSRSGLIYFSELKGSRMEHKMDHLACFSGGMFALQSVNEVNQSRREHFLALGKEITKTCHESYARTTTRLGPESFRFTNEVEAVAVNEREKYYILRPEVIESYFYLWRVTHDPIYRQWAWDAAQAIEKYCKVGVGYSGIRNVYADAVQHDDVQQSFFLAETLKYLYLTFSPDSLYSLDEWVFNTEAHPLPVYTPRKFDSTQAALDQLAKAKKDVDEDTVNLLPDVSVVHLCSNGCVEK